MDRKVKLRVEPSLYPEEDQTHILVLESSTTHGCNIERIFKGTRRKCLEKKRELEDKDDSKR